MRLTLFTEFPLRATHSLEENETPHTHLWHVKVGVQGRPEEGRIVSLPLLRELLWPLVDRFTDRHLNEDAGLDPETRRNPTCENLASFFFARFKEALRDRNLAISEVEVSVMEDGEQLGYARVTPE